MVVVYRILIVLFVFTAVVLYQKYLENYRILKNEKTFENTVKIDHTPQKFDFSYSIASVNNYQTVIKEISDSNKFYDYIDKMKIECFPTQREIIILLNSHGFCGR